MMVFIEVEYFYLFKIWFMDFVAKNGYLKVNFRILVDFLLIIF